MILPILPSKLVGLLNTEFQKWDILASNQEAAPLLLKILQADPP